MHGYMQVLYHFIWRTETSMDFDVRVMVLEPIPCRYLRTVVQDQFTYQVTESEPASILSKYLGVKRQGLSVVFWFSMGHLSHDPMLKIKYLESSLWIFSSHFSVSPDIGTGQTELWPHNSYMNTHITPTHRCMCTNPLNTYACNIDLHLHRS